MIKDLRFLVMIKKSDKAELDLLLAFTNRLEPDIGE